MTAVLRTFLFAWQFLTAIPLSRSTHDAKPEELAASMSWYPFVGCLLGLLLVGVDRFLAQVFSSSVTSMFVMLVLIGVTRGLHQDGLADMVDGLAGGRTPQARGTHTLVRSAQRDYFSRSACDSLGSLRCQWANISRF
jgi:adenosylcobinamide-GDP ribazoletransferase